jgi:hypothetical protein
MSYVYTKNKIIEQCYHSCPFFTVNGNCMECNHPYFDDRNPYERLIIDQKNSKNTVPEHCPLRKSDLHIKFQLKK